MGFLFCCVLIGLPPIKLTSAIVMFGSGAPFQGHLSVSYLFLRVPPNFFFLVGVLIIVVWLCFVGREDVCLFFL